MNAAAPPYSPASSWAGRPNIVMAPPHPPTAPPPSAAIRFDFLGVLLTLCGAVAMAIGFLILQWWCCTYVLPQREAARQRQRAMEAKLRAAQEAEEAAKQERHQQELMQEVAPAPRVRMVAWTGKDIAGAVTAAPPATAPLRYPQKKPKVHPAPVAHANDMDDEVDYERIGDRRSVLKLWTSPFVVSQCLLGSGVGFGVVYVFFSLLLTQNYYLLTDGMVLTVVVLSPPLSGLTAPFFAPLAMPEAAAKGWLGWVAAEDLPLWMVWLPFVSHPRAIVRLLSLAVFAAAVFIPIGMLFLTYWLPSPLGIWRMHVIYFAALYVVCVTWVILPLGLLGYCVDANYDRVMRSMSMEKDQLRRLTSRLAALPFS